MKKLIVSSLVVVAILGVIASVKRKSVDIAHSDNKEQVLKNESVLSEVFMVPPKADDESEVLIKTARDRRVYEKLEAFKRNTAHISAESVAAERERINKALAEAKNKPTVLPHSKRIVDENGDAWQMLTFDNGIVRYDFVSK
jgi:hypothetical protein